jgi:hypothetical protein
MYEELKRAWPYVVAGKFNRGKLLDTAAVLKSCNQIRQRSKFAMSYQTPAQKQFHTSSIYPYPEGYTPFKIRNDYPLTPKRDHYPWLQFDPKKQSGDYLNAVKEYVFEGMIDNEFDPRKNTVNLIDYLFFESSSHTSYILEERLVPRLMDALRSSRKRAPPRSYSRTLRSPP